MVTPTSITPTTVHSSWAGATYVWKQTVGSYEIYNLAFNGVATNNNHEIQVDTTTNTWSDYGNNNPHTVTDNGSTVTLSSGSTTYVVFTKPTTASWISSGGGTSTEGVLSVEKTLTQVGSTVVAFVGAGNASVSNLTIIDVDGWPPSNPGVSVWHSHTYGTDTTFSWPISESGIYRLMNLQIQYAIVTASLSKKVSCNFW